MTVTELLRDMRAEHSARITYARAVTRHFIEAERLAKSDPRKSLDVARAAVALRMDARYELRS